MPNPIDWQPLKELIDANQRFVLTSHVRPDADAIGSEQGLAAILKSLGKTVRIINPSATSAHLKFLDPDNVILKIKEQVSIEYACETDVHIVVDTSARAQLNDMCKVLDSTNAAKVVIDHHETSDNLEALDLRDTTASATGVLIAELSEYLGVTLSAEAATQLYAAIATDTGWFRFPNTDSRTLKIASMLIDSGAKPHLLYRELYERSSLARLKLQARVLDRVALVAEGRVAHTFVRVQDFRETHTHPSDTEDLVNYGLTIEGVEIAVILIEQTNKQVKASFRSRSGLDVAAVARQFGGGGHRQASGAMLAGPIESAREQVLKALTSALET